MKMLLRLQCFALLFFLLLSPVYSKEKNYHETSEKENGADIKTLLKTRDDLEKSNNRRDAILVSITIAENYEKAGKYPKAIKELEKALSLSIAIKDDRLIEKAYEKLYEDYKKSGNEKKAAENFGHFNSYKTKRENRDLEWKNKQSQLQISKLKEQKLLSELGKAEAENMLEEQTVALLQTEDSLQVLDLVNKERQTQIDLLSKEKELKDLKVKEQEARLKNEALLLKEQEATLKMGRWILYTLVAGILMAAALGFVLYKNYKTKQQASAKIEEQLTVIQSQHQNITNSINYAQRIQTAMLPHEKSLHALIPDSFILFKPKDIVSGDFYWFYNIKTNSNLNEYNPIDEEGLENLPTESNSKKIIVAAVDCTGHGVPGALMSMIGYNLLNNVVSRGIQESNKILSELNNSVRFALQQYKNDNKDGMDMALCVIDKEQKKLHFSGAKNPLVYIQNGELFYIKGDKDPIGGSQGEARREYTKHTIDIDKPTYFYIFSDGYLDQFGGPESKKFMIKNFKELLLSIHLKPFAEQKEILNTTIQDWKGNHEKQLDDILVMGMRVG